MSDSAPQPANETRGEISLLLEGVAYPMRPSFEAIVAFEKDTGRALLELAVAAEAQRLKITELAAIATRCIQAAGKAQDQRMWQAFNADRIGELMLAEDGGMFLANKRIALLLFDAATGGYTAAGEPKAVTGTIRATPAAA